MYSPLSSLYFNESVSSCVFASWGDGGLGNVFDVKMVAMAALRWRST